MNSIREHLKAQAAQITDSAGERFPSKGALLAARTELRTKDLEMMGIVDLAPPGERPAPEVTVTGTTEKDAYVIERLYYESLPRLYVTANLYMPRKAETPAPAVAYFCGHSDIQKLHYQNHARRWAELGFVTLIVDTVQFGEVKGHHHGCYSQGWFNWYSRGYTPGGVELLNGIRAVDLLQSRDEVDPERIGVTGISGGGSMSWWLGAGDERLKAVAPVCGTGTLRSHIAERSLDGHCDCMYFINYYGWDLADLAALIAPRPLLICSADHDGIYSIESIRECYQRSQKSYDLLGASDNIRLIETPGPHSYHETSRKGIFSWFFKHLCGKDVPPKEIDDVDEYEANDIPNDELLVYTSECPPPADERTSVVQDSFVPLAEPPDITDANGLQAERDRVVAALRERTFRHFPAKPCDLDYREEFEYSGGNALFRRFSFASEDGWRLHGRLVMPSGIERRRAPVLLYPHNPRYGRWQADEIWAGFDLGWHRVDFQPRGVGETSWGNELAWHVRRASAVTGSTIASMRVYDILRAFELVRGLPECNGTVVVAAREELAAAALYAALLDGQMNALALSDLPPTQDVPSNPDGTGAALEMLGVLRFTDLPVVAALLFPAELVFIGNRPGSYRYAESTYATLGEPGRITHVKGLRDWRARER